jgi:RNA polymerase sigma factor (TIGR02999 family)
MGRADTAEITRLLRAWSSGEQSAFERLAPLVYEELRRIAKRHMRREQPGHTLQTTAVVNEAFLRLIQGARVDWCDRVHFFAVSAQIMRRILVDAARARMREKRGGLSPDVNLDEAIDATPARAAALVALDEALDELSVFDPRKARVVELRYFGGLSVEETAEALSISAQSVMRDWKLAKAWLARNLNR